MPYPVGCCIDDVTSRLVKAEAFRRIECSQSNVTPIHRSLRYVTELLDRVQNEHAKAISFAFFYMAPSRLVLSQNSQVRVKFLARS